MGSHNYFEVNGKLVANYQQNFTVQFCEKYLFNLNPSFTHLISPKIYWGIKIYWPNNTTKNGLKNSSFIHM